jgi:hypothetical protein
MASERVSQRALFGVSALLFAASVAVTIVSCARMAAGSSPRDKHLNKQEVNYAESSRFVRGMAEGAP